MPDVDGRVVVVEDQPVRAEPEERGGGAFDAPAHTECAAHLREIDDRAAVEVRRCCTEYLGKAAHGDRTAGGQAGERQVAGRDLVVGRVRVEIRRCAGAGEVEDLGAATVDRVQLDVDLPRQDRVDDAAEVRDVHAHGTLGSVEQDLR